MMLQFGFPEHREPRETRLGAGAIQQTTNALQIFRRILPLPLLPQELRRSDSLDAMLQPLVPARLAFEASYRSLESLLFPARSTEYLPWCHPKRCAPSPAKLLLTAANTQNCDAW